MPVDVLLLDGENRSTLAACRSLGVRGLKVAVVGPPGCITHASKYCAVHLEFTPSNDPKSYLTQIKKFIEDHSPKLFLPMSDRSLAVVCDDEQLLATAPIAGKKALITVQNKEEILSLSESLSLKIPAGKLVTSQNDISDWSYFPAVLKTARAGVTERREKPPVRYFEKLSELNEFVIKHAEQSPWLLQEKIVGPGVGVFILAKDGEIIATFCHQRILDKPPTGGVSVLSKSIDSSSAPVAQAHKVIEKLKWNGVAMVEFKISAKTGEPYLMEINPRFWGTLQLAITSGVDFPWLLWLQHTGQLDSIAGQQALGLAKQYQVGKHLRWDLGTLDHFLIRAKNEGIFSAISLIFRNELRLFANHNILHETWQSGDGAPFLSEVKNYFRNLLK